MKPTYFKNDSWDCHSIGGSASTTTFEIDFKKPLTVGEFIEVLKSVKDEAYFGVVSTGLIRYVANHNKGDFEILENLEEDKDKPIKEAYINLSWSEMNFNLKL